MQVDMGDADYAHHSPPCNVPGWFGGVAPPDLPAYSRGLAGMTGGAQAFTPCVFSRRLKTWLLHVA